MFRRTVMIFSATLCFVIAYKTSDDTPNTCTLPVYPKNGFYTIHDESTERPSVKIHNQPVLRSRVRLEYSCRRGYKLTGPTSVSCFTGYWTHTELPICLSQCVLTKESSVNHLCLPKNSTTLDDAFLCGELVDEDTKVRPQCRSPFYYYNGELADMQCEGGVWSYVATCTPDCGAVTSNRQLVMQPANYGNTGTPWHVGVYFKLKDPYLQICGGTIITSEVVISAAHCFWGEVKRQRPASDFAVAAGKFYRHWNSQLDHNVQKSDVQEIRLPPRFTGLQTNYQDDIAVLKVTTPFQFGTYVRPICVDFNYNFDKSQLTVGKIGKIASWGRSAQDGVEDHWQFLQEVDLPFVSDEQCLMESPPGFLGYITADKFCAYYNDTARELCQGDTGGGLVFPAQSRGEERYFLRGVASTARGDKQNCVMFTTFTQVIKHEQFIKDHYTPLKDNCVLPPFPDNGTYSTNLPNARPGEAYDTVNISVTCQQGYAVDRLSLVYCYNGQWSDRMPKCVSQCHLAPHYSVEYRCLVPGGGLRACNEYELTGTVVRPRCRSPEYYSTAALDDMRCIDGNWTYVARCSPAGHCFWNFAGGHQRPAADYAVAIGKLVRLWGASTDEGYEQQSDVKEVHLPTGFRGAESKFTYDIAVVKVSVPFNYTAYVRPVCLDFNANLNRRQLQPGAIGMVAGWVLTPVDGVYINELKYLNMPYVNLDTCKSEAPNRYLSNITSEVICAGYKSDAIQIDFGEFSVHYSYKGADF